MPHRSRTGLRNAGGVLLLVVLLATGAYGGDLFGIRDRLQPPPEPAVRIAHGPSPSSGVAELASQPWWQDLTTIQGTAGLTPTLSIGDGAIQWRATWSCGPGAHLTVQPVGGTGFVTRTPLIDAGCPGTGVAYSTRTGKVPLQVTSSGPWQLHIEQQVDVQLHEPPTPAMAVPGAAVSTGSFYDIDQKGHGRVTVYRVADGSYALRLDSFYVTPNSELEIRFSAQSAPHSDDEVNGAPVAVVASLPTTAGSMNFVVPHDVDPSKFRSVVVWCRTVQTAYAGASLGKVA